MALGTQNGEIRLMSRVGTKSLALVLVALTVIAYLPVWANDFVDFDDELYITTNPNVIGGMTGANFCWAWSNLRGNYWQPLTWLSLQLDAHFFSKQGAAGEPILAPAAFHGQNLFWHTANVVLLFTLWQRLTEARWRSFGVAALFAVHPMHVESVAWAVERKDVLSLFFGLLTLWAYVRYLETPGWKRYAAMLAALLAGLMAKPMLLTLPFVLLLLDYWPLRRMTPASWRRLVWEKVPLFLVAAAIAAVTVVARERTGATVSLQSLPLSDRLPTAAAAYGWYVFATFWPVNLAVLYPHPHSDWSLTAALAGGAVLSSLTALALWQARRRPWLTCGWLWFAGTLLPVIGLAQGGEQAWADRFCYWPHVGLFVAIVWGVADRVVRFHIPARVVVAAATLVILALASLTWRQVGYWRDTKTLWEHALAATANNHRAYLNLGKYHLDRLRFDEAAANFAESVRLRPDFPDYRYSDGVALLSLGKLPEAAEQFRAALLVDGRSVDAWHNLGIARLSEGKSDAAVRSLRNALALEPESADAWASLGRALWRQGEREEAVRCFREALRRDPREAWAWHGLGMASLAEGDTEKAAAAFRRAKEINPQMLIAYSDLGVALGRQQEWASAADSHLRAVLARDEADKLLMKMNGRPALMDGMSQAVIFRCRLAYALGQLGEPMAARAYREALERDPDWPAKFTAIAWRLATAADANRRDPELAFEMVSQAVQAVGEADARMLDVLAAAQASRNQFSEAILTARQALTKAASSSDSAFSQTIDDHLKLYERGKPVRLQVP
jgi:tetratricopeptide (TPR) repeat protein